MTINKLCVKAGGAKIQQMYKLLFMVTVAHYKSDHLTSTSLELLPETNKTSKEKTK